MVIFRFIFEVIRYLLLITGILNIIELYIDGRSYNRKDYLFIFLINLINVFYYLYIRKKSL